MSCFLCVFLPFTVEENSNIVPIFLFLVRYLTPFSGCNRGYSVLFVRDVVIISADYCAYIPNQYEVLRPFQGPHFSALIYSVRTNNFLHFSFEVIFLNLHKYPYI